MLFRAAGDPTATSHGSAGAGAAGDRGAGCAGLSASCRNRASRTRRRRTSGIGYLLLSAPANLRSCGVPTSLLPTISASIASTTPLHNDTTWRLPVPAMFVGIRLHLLFPAWTIDECMDQHKATPSVGELGTRA